MLAIIRLLTGQPVESRGEGKELARNESDGLETAFLHLMNRKCIRNVLMRTCRWLALCDSAVGLLDVVSVINDQYPLDQHPDPICTKLSFSVL